MASVAQSVKDFTNFETRVKSFFETNFGVADRLERFFTQFGVARDFDRDEVFSLRPGTFALKLAFSKNDIADDRFFVFGIVRFEDGNETLPQIKFIGENSGTEANELFEAFKSFFA